VEDGDRDSERGPWLRRVGDAGVGDRPQQRVGVGQRLVVPPASPGQLRQTEMGLPGIHRVRLT
jgi:hypothetical protein